MRKLLTGEVSKPLSVAQRARRVATRKLRRTKSGIVGTAKYSISALKRFYGTGRYSLAPLSIAGGGGRIAARSKMMSKAMAKGMRQGATLVGPSPKAQKMLKLQKGLRRAHLIRRVATPVAAVALLATAARYQNSKKRRR